MFVRPSNPQWPPDLGYWMGYRIAKRYYEQADDKRQAVIDRINAEDNDAILEQSRYTALQDE